MITRSILRFTFISALFFISCRRDPDIITPIVLIESFPSTGDTSTYFCFDGSNSNDNQSEIWQLRFQWDFDGDGLWDTDLSSEPKYVWRFSSYGFKTIILKVTDHAGCIGRDTCSILVAPNFDDSIFTDARDGNRYRSIRIDNQWWMAENLRYGAEISAGSLPSDNGVVEKFLYRDSLNRLVSESGYYNWDEATHYRASMITGICPEGWRLTNYYDYLSLFNRFAWFLHPYNLFKPDGSLGIDLTTGGLYSFFTGKFSFYNEYGFLSVSQKNSSDDPYNHYIFWYHISNYFPHIYYSDKDEQTPYPVWWDRVTGGDKMDFNKIGINVRCIKKDL